MEKLVAEVKEDSAAFFAADTAIAVGAAAADAEQQ